MAEDPECSPLFALPHIRNPTNHPLIADVYTQEWRNAVKHELDRFLSRNLVQYIQPRLRNLYLAHQTQHAELRKIIDIRDKELKDVSFVFPY